MSEATKPWDIAELTINFLGIDLNRGLGEGEGTVKIEKTSNDFESTVGADGSVARSRTHDDRYMVTITLLQTSSVNAILSGIRFLDTSVPNGAGVGPLTIADRLGLDIFSGTEAWIVGPPKTVEYGPKAGNREWVLEVADGIGFIGGA